MGKTLARPNRNIAACYQTAQHYNLGEAKMSKVTIFQFELYIPQNDEIRKSRRWGTREAIEKIALGKVLEDTATEVDESAIASDIHGLTERDFNPW